ncbi:hypothetical protein Tco_0397520 [Tanacetum coccineum]
MLYRGVVLGYECDADKPNMNNSVDAIGNSRGNRPLYLDEDFILKEIVSMMINPNGVRVNWCYVYDHDQRLLLVAAGSWLWMGLFTLGYEYEWSWDSSMLLCIYFKEVLNEGCASTYAHTYVVLLMHEEDLDVESTELRVVVESAAKADRTLYASSVSDPSNRKANFCVFETGIPTSDKADVQIPMSSVSEANARFENPKTYDGQDDKI